MTHTDDSLVYSSKRPLVADLIEEYSRCGPAHNGWNRLQGSDETRFCVWPGRSPDGKKWDKNMPQGDRAFPWNGANDARVHLADELINDCTALEVIAFWRALVQFQGVEAGDLDTAGIAQKLFEWVMGARQYKELVSQVELHSQYTHTYGWSVLMITWEQELQLKLVKVKLQELIAQVQQAYGTEPGELLAQLLQMIPDPELDAQSAALIHAQAPAITMKRARQAVRDLRETGEAAVPLPYPCRNDPCIMALKPYEEVLVPEGATDIQRCRVFVRRWYTEVELRAKATGEGWDPAWTEEAVKSKGHFSTWTTIGSGPDTMTLAKLDDRGSFSTADTKQNLIEVVECFHRQLDEDNIPGIWRTVFNPHVCRSVNGRELAAKHELLDYAHGRMPFVVRKREHASPTITSSRGVPEIVATWQRAVKVQEDAIADQTSLGVLPPILVPMVQGVDYRFGPAAQIPSSGPNRDPRFMVVPTNGVPVAFEMMDRIERRADRYFGRLRSDLPPENAQTRQQMLVQSNLLSWAEAFQQEFALLAQFKTPEEIERITGGALPQDAASIENQPDLILTFDVRELSTDYMKIKLSAIKDFILPIDALGVIDRGKLVQMSLRAIDPSLARELVVDEQSASKKLFEQVKLDFATMLLGFEPDYVELDPTAKSQLQFAETLVQSNPTVQEALQTNPRFKELAENWQKNRQQSVMQEENKVVGRIGVQTGGGGMGE